MIDSIIKAAEFLLIFILACIIIYKVFKYMKTLTITKNGVSVKFDFYIDTKNEPSNPKEWIASKVDGKTSLSLDDFTYFVANDVWKQTPLSENDRENFAKMKSLLTDDPTIVKKYWQRNYLFNIKFATISRMVKEYKQTWSEVLNAD